MAPGLVGRYLLGSTRRRSRPDCLPASRGRRLDLRAHERTAESTAGDGVAAAVTGICNRCIRHAARYRQGSAARRALQGMTMANLASNLVKTASGLGDAGPSDRHDIRRARSGEFASRRDASRGVRSARS